MGVLYGEWKGIQRPIADSVGDDVFYIDDAADLVDPTQPGDNNVDNDAAEANADPPDADPPEPAPNNNRVLHAMRQLESSFNPDATDFVARHSAEGQPAGRESEQAAINCSDFSSFDSLACLTMLDRLQLGPEELALTAIPEQLKPEQYKDVFNVPFF
jgi:hypothetical protein